MNKHLVDMIEFVTKQFERTKTISPMAVGIKENGERVVATFPLPDAKSKHTIIGEVKKIFRKHEVVAILFMSEMWYVERTEVLPESLPPSDCVDRKEAVMVHYIDASGTQSAILDIEGDKNAKVLGKMHCIEGKTTDDYLWSDYFVELP